MKRLARAGVALAIALLSPSARAGGFEIPDNGTEALGRGGAFVAKADDPTAIQYNPAGLAQQRGTRVLLDGHLMLSSYSFQRYGAFPDNPNDAKTPWGGQPYPKVQDTGGPFFAPFIAATSDFGLDWLTAAIGVFGPSGVGNRTYPLGVDGAPAASRYDVVQTSSLIALPTAAVGVKVFDWLDLGAAVHFVYGSFSLTSTSFVDIATAACPNVEYQPCDSVSRLDVKGTGWAGTLGALVHASPNLTIGASVRTPISIDASGSATVLTAPLGQSIPPPGNATFHTDLPLYARAGARLAFRDDDGFEAGDVELDGTYETWGTAQALGPTIHIDHLGPSGPAFDDINVKVAHAYNDTYSIRGGGAFNTKLGFGVLTLRAGAYYDRSATAQNPGYTRLDFDTLDKIAGTVGVGLRWHGLLFNLGYAEVFEPDRTVYQGDGQLRPIDGAQHGAPVDANGNLLPPVNQGVFSGHTEIISFGVVATLDDLFGWKHDAPKGHETEKKEQKPRDDEAPAPKAAPRDEEASAAHAAAAAKAAPPGPPRRKALAKKSDWDD
ncbi:MAG TPA: outer membrane protein transport protein [Polyangiaceae bacterium]|nr:outer membrane protein transport protein [Polyangiaceae bacterium]